jgi:hypothetical protein
MKNLKFKFECSYCGRVEYIKNPTSVRIKCPDADCLKYLFCWNDAETTGLQPMREALLEDLRLDWIKDSKPEGNKIDAEESLSFKKGRDLIILAYEPSKKTVTVKLNDAEQIIYPVKNVNDKINVFRHGVMKAYSTPVN